MEYAMDFPESILTEIFPIRSSNMQAFHLTKASFIFAKLNRAALLTNRGASFFLLVTSFGGLEKNKDRLTCLCKSE
jgi:hypothetical protein